MKRKKPYVWEHGIYHMCREHMEYTICDDTCKERTHAWRKGKIHMYREQKENDPYHPLTDVSSEIEKILKFLSLEKSEVKITSRYRSQKNILVNIAYFEFSGAMGKIVIFYVNPCQITDSSERSWVEDRLRAATYNSFFLDKGRMTWWKNYFECSFVHSIDCFLDCSVDRHMKNNSLSVCSFVCVRVKGQKSFSLNIEYFKSSSKIGNF